MLSYRHAFHAGGFADVAKHAVLLVLLEAMCRKATPLFYLDTHAGAGRYRLKEPMPEKLAESARGIQRVRAAAGTLDATTARLLELVEPYLRLDCYPGSPKIAADLLRASDAMMLCERHPADVKALRLLFRRRANSIVRHEDGYAAMRANLPPRQRRALTFIDPAYERRDETSHILRAVSASLQRFAHGVYALWYPVDERGVGAVLRRGLLEMGCKKLLLCECRIASVRTAGRLQGSGMLIVNPPFRCDAQIDQAYACLSRVCAEHRSASTGHDVRWLVGELADV